jgi:hypothetical protein
MDSALEEGVTSELVSVSLLAGSLQGNSSKRGSVAYRSSEISKLSQCLTGNSLRTRTGNLFWRSRELNHAIREIIRLIREAPHRRRLPAATRAFGVGPMRDAWDRRVARTRASLRRRFRAFDPARRITVCRGHRSRRCGRYVSGATTAGAAARCLVPLRTGLMVRIRFPPAASQQTLDPLGLSLR